MNSKSQVNTIKNDSPFLSVLFSDFISYINDKLYIVPLIITAIGSYFFLITNYTVSVDDLEGARYRGGELLAQGRFSSNVINSIFRFPANTVSIKDFLGMTALCIGTILFCIVFDRCFKTKNRIPQMLFSCLFVSFPLHSELFSYSGCFLAIGAECILAAFGLLCVMQFFETKKIRYLIYPIPGLILTASWYESVLLVYIQAVFFIFILQMINDKTYRLRDLISKGLVFALPLAAAVAIEAAVSSALMAILHLEKSENAVTDFGQHMVRTGSFSKQLSEYINSVAGRLVLSVLNYFPIQIFLSSIAVFFVLIIVCAVKHRKNKAGILLCGFGAFISNFIIILILGYKIHYRTCQSFAFFTAFTVMLSLILLCRLKGRKAGRLSDMIYKVVCVLAALLVMIQVNVISEYFTTDWLRYKFEENVMNSIGIELSKNYDLSKNVIFVGKIEMSDEVTLRSTKAPNAVLYNMMIKVPGMKEKLKRQGVYGVDEPYPIQYTNCQSYINWAQKSFDQEPLINLLKFLGFSGIKNGTKAQLEEATASVDNTMPSWPQNGYITENDDFIIVKIGEIKTAEADTEAE